MQGETFLFFGIIGSGKGTQIKLLMDFLKKRDSKEAVYVYPGNEYRKLMESGSFAGALVQGPVLRGELLPGFLTNAIVTNILITSLSSDKHLIVDGYPRAVDQSENFEQVLKFFNRDNTLKVPPKDKKRKKSSASFQGFSKIWDSYFFNASFSLIFYFFGCSFGQTLFLGYGSRLLRRLISYRKSNFLFYRTYPFGNVSSSCEKTFQGGELQKPLIYFFNPSFTSLSRHNSFLSFFS